MFGTDGVRGVAGTDLTIDLAMKLGQAGAYVLTKEQEHQPTIIVGCDTRISGGMLANALMAGICSVGANAIFVGVAPTPAIAPTAGEFRRSGRVQCTGPNGRSPGSSPAVHRFSPAPGTWFPSRASRAFQSEQNRYSLWPAQRFYTFDEGAAETVQRGSH